MPERGAEWYRLPAPRRRPDLWGSSGVAAGQQAGQQAWQAARASEYAQLGDGPSLFNRITICTFCYYKTKR